jgi:hypothetical protein
MEVVELVVGSDHDSMLLPRAPSQPDQASKRYLTLQAIPRRPPQVTAINGKSLTRKSQLS